MATQVRIQRASGGLTFNETAVFGFSWTCLFWSWVVPFFRGDYVAGAVACALWVVALCFGGVPALVINVGMAFLYNKRYLVQKLTNGWVLADTPQRNAECANAIGVSI